ncbi:hypothetical protein X276_27655 [Clostridium beijerinckii NRRL B-598]|nr:hypothetical protein X276_27655 [Clostridium beijerinckii NRRL B-598]
MIFALFYFALNQWFKGICVIIYINFYTNFYRRKNKCNKFITSAKMLVKTSATSFGKKYRYLVFVHSYLKGQSKISSNYNPKYAQYSITILRTFYNFCWTFKSGNGDVLTPAQRIGITDKQFNYNDIIYFS